MRETTSQKLPLPVNGFWGMYRERKIVRLFLLEHYAPF